LPSGAVDPRFSINAKIGIISGIGKKLQYSAAMGKVLGGGNTMTICLYGSPISTFARKVAIGLDLKGLSYDLVDALTPDRREELRKLNPRLEVPVLTDGDLVIVNSSDILQYLDWRYPEQPLYPAAIEERVMARAFERLCDQRFDPIVVDCSYWSWAERDDRPPPGLREAAQQDIDVIFDRLERVLISRPKPWPFETPGVLECAWFANLAALRTFGLALDQARYPSVTNWFKAMRTHPVFATDAQRTLAFLRELKHLTHERRKLFWSGDRMEWLLSRGFHRWFAGEIDAGRAVFPG
jgi:glutathione S-transferase